MKDNTTDLYQKVHDEITGSRSKAEELLGHARSSGVPDDSSYQILWPEEANWEDY